MKFFKLAIVTIASVSFLAACSDDSHSVKGTSNSEQTQEQDTQASLDADEALKTTLQSYQETMVNIQLLAEPGVIALHCSEDQIKNALGNDLNRVLENSASADSISSSLQQILSRTSDQDCQLATLNRVAQEASKKFGSVLNGTQPNSSEFAKVGSSMEQLALISSVIGPKVNELKSSILESSNANTRENFRSGAVYYYKIRENLNVEILKLQVVIESAEKTISGCSLSASMCAEEFAYIKQLTSLNKDILSQVTSAVSRLESLSVNDSQLTQKISKVQNLIVVTVVGRVLLEKVVTPVSDVSEKAVSEPIVSPYGPQ